MAMGSYLSIITLNVNGLNAPTKRQRLAEWMQKQDHYICCLQETQRVQNRINPRQNTPRHINQINKDQTQGINIKSSKGKATNNTQGDSHKDNS